MPSAAELPSYETYNTETPSPLNPLGAKGIGESATLGSTPAVHNAIVDAVSHLGIRHIDMPCTAERVWRALQSALGMRRAPMSRAPTLRLTESQYAHDHRQLLRRSARRGVRAVARAARRRRTSRRARSPRRGRAATPTRRRCTYTVDPRDMLAREPRGRGARRRDRRRVALAHPHRPVPVADRRAPGRRPRVVLRASSACATTRRCCARTASVDGEPSPKAASSSTAADRRSPPTVGFWSAPIARRGR